MVGLPLVTRQHWLKRIISSIPVPNSPTRLSIKFLQRWPTTLWLRAFPSFVKFIACWFLGLVLVNPMGGTLIILTRYGRRDLSFTCFWVTRILKGGSLTIQTGGQEIRISLPPGQVVIYPSSMLHCVEPVVSGTRYVCVGWLESYVKSAEDRALLFHLDAGARGTRPAWSIWWAWFDFSKLYQCCSPFISWIVAFECASCVF